MGKGDGGGGGGGGWVLPKLQALVYDILPWRKVPESDARSVECGFYFQVSRVGQGGLSEEVDGGRSGGGVGWGGGYLAILMT